jgi:glutathione synthase/RimK-type ligase-like ATP-grasp enzyme
MLKEYKIGVGIDWAGWCKRFSQALDDYIAQGIAINYDLINLESVDWLDRIAPYDVIIWNPNYMGIKLASHLKEKIYFIQSVLHKKVFPSFNTVWHFESKVAQSYIFSHYKIQTPRTFVSFDYSQAFSHLNSTDLPVVLKKSEGAGSSNVQLIKTRKKLRSTVESAFANQFWRDSRKIITRQQFIVQNFTKRRFWFWLSTKLFHQSKADGVIYWQEYIPDNKADLRITVIGDSLAYGYWRNNRPNDFRASGSGLLDYEREIPHELLSYCMKINSDLKFDSMCYDIIFSRDSFVITEMSYNYIADYLFKDPGYYEKNINGDVVFINMHTWPEHLWVKWIIFQLGLLSSP